MEGQLRPGLRADDDDEEEEEEEEVVMVVVLELTVVLEEDVEEDEVVAGAGRACTSLADESTLRCIFSTLTAGVRILSGVLKCVKGVLRGVPGSFSLAGLRSLGLEEEEDAEEDDKLDPAVEGRLRMPPLATPATDPEPSPGPSPLPLLRFLPDTGKGEVEAGLLAELCLLS